MRIINNIKKVINGLTDDELRQRIDFAEDTKKMLKTDGWIRHEALLKEQLQAYIADNSTNALDWNDYLKKSGKIFGINLLLTNIEESIRQGEEAKELLDNS
jgi:hypothetical protein